MALIVAILGLSALASAVAMAALMVASEADDSRWRE